MDFAVFLNLLADMWVFILIAFIGLVLIQNILARPIRRDMFQRVQNFDVDGLAEGAPLYYTIISIVTWIVGVALLASIGMNIYQLAA